ncbi:MAG TPA: hypothetical protein VMV93_00675 [Chloroflexota bacterium]|nr:hypothetical protein [Chloroflexota bacterium]
MMNQPRRHRDASLWWLAGLMILAWLGLAFAAKMLAADPATTGYGAFVGFLVIALTLVAYCLFMMAVDSDKS